MSNTRIYLSRKTRQVNLGIPVLLLFIAASATFSSIRWISAVPAKKTAPVSSEAAAVRSVQMQNRLEAERVTLRPTGFEPVEISRPAGRFLLAVNDRSGEINTSITLVRESGERLKEVRLRDTPRKYEWREALNLPPGRYLLVDSANLNHVCHIQLTN